MATKKIPPLDLLFFLLETPGSPKHVGAVQIFRKPRNAPGHYMRDLVRDIKAVPVEPPLNFLNSKSTSSMFKKPGCTRRLLRIR